jgi:hypothetical protein
MWFLTVVGLGLDPEGQSTPPVRSSRTLAQASLLSLLMALSASSTF